MPTPDALQQIELDIQSGRLNEARAKLIQLLKAEPKNAQAWYLASFMTTDPVKQKEVLDRALNIDPDHARAHSRLQLIELGNHPSPAPIKAEVEADARSASACAAQGLFSEAIRLYSRAISADPRFKQAYLERGMCRELLDDRNGAAADYQRYLDLGGEDYDGKVNESIQQIRTDWIMGGAFQTSINRFAVLDQGAVPASQTAVRLEPEGRAPTGGWASPVEVESERQATPPVVSRRTFTAAVLALIGAAIMGAGLLLPWLHFQGQALTGFGLTLTAIAKALHPSTVHTVGQQINLVLTFYAPVLVSAVLVVLVIGALINLLLRGPLHWFVWIAMLGVLVAVLIPYMTFLRDDALARVSAEAGYYVSLVGQLIAIVAALSGLLHLVPIAALTPGGTAATGPRLSIGHLSINLVGSAVLLALIMLAAAVGDFILNVHFP